MLLTPLQDGSNRLHLYLLQGISHPRGTAAQRIIQVPAQRHHTAPVILFDDLLTDTIERDSVQIGGIAQFEMSEVETLEGRIVVADALHVRTVFVAFPSDAIDGIVMMSEEIDTTVA